MKSSTSSPDLRIRRTYKFLWDALISLMAERDFASITVTDLCERAMVHRTTFYKHYEDKDGLLLHGIQSELNALFAAVDQSVAAPVARGELPDTRVWLGAVFEHVLRQGGFYRLMLTGDGFSQFGALLRKSLAARLERRLLQEGKQMSLPIALHADVQAAALVSMLSWWLENDCPYTPVEMIKYIDEHLDLVGGSHARDAPTRHHR